MMLKQHCYLVQITVAREEMLEQQIWINTIFKNILIKNI